MEDQLYIIVASSAPGHVSDLVSKYLEDGYALRGPMQVTGTNGMFRYAQAMIYRPSLELKDRLRLQ